MRRVPALILVLGLAGVARAAPRPPDDAAAMSVAVDGQGEVEVGPLVVAWARRFEALAVVDAAVQPLHVRFLGSVGDLSWGVVKQILALNDIVVVESQPTPGGPWIIRAHHERDAAQKEEQSRLVEGQAVPDWEEVVTAVFRIRHGAGAMIFGTLRGIVQARDPTRIGVSQYVQGPELIIVVDLASRVRFAARVIEALDVQGPQRELRTFELRHAPASEVAAGLNGLLGALAGAGGQPGLGPQQPGLGAPFVYPDQRGNQLLVAAFAQDLPVVERIVADLDRPTGGSTSTAAATPTRPTC